MLSPAGALCHPSPPRRDVPCLLLALCPFPTELDSKRGWLFPSALDFKYFKPGCFWTLRFTESVRAGGELGHSPGSTHRGAEQVVAPLSPGSRQHPVPQDRGSRLRGWSPADPHVPFLRPPPLPHSDPPCWGSTLPLCHWVWWEKVSYISALLLPPPSPQPPRVLLVMGVRTGPGSGSARPISRSTLWFSLLEKWFLPTFLGQVSAPLLLG